MPFTPPPFNWLPQLRQRSSVASMLSPQTALPLWSHTFRPSFPFETSRMTGTPVSTQSATASRFQSAMTRRLSALLSYGGHRRQSVTLAAHGFAHFTLSLQTSDANPWIASTEFVRSRNGPARRGYALYLLPPPMTSSVK